MTAPTIQLTSATPPAPMAPMQMTQLPQHIPATAAFPPAVTPMPQRPAFYPPMLYWYPSPPVSPQTFFTHPGPCAIVMRGLPYNVTVTDVVNYFQGFPEVGRKLGRMNTFDLLCACTRVLLKLPPFFFLVGNAVVLVWVWGAVWWFRRVPSARPSLLPSFIKPPWLFEGRLGSLSFSLNFVFSLKLPFCFQFCSVQASAFA